MVRKFISQPTIVIVLLCLQFIPLMLFPPESFAPTTQEWWLPVLLAILTLVGVFQLVVRRSIQMWPWYLMSFAQGFNIISRLMMLMPHASVFVDGEVRLNTPYVVLTLVSILLSATYIWYSELPEVRMSLFARQTEPVQT
jgi:hypothetical protein